MNLLLVAAAGVGPGIIGWIIHILVYGVAGSFIGKFMDCQTRPIVCSIISIVIGIPCMFIPFGIVRYVVFLLATSGVIKISDKLFT